MAKPFIKWVGGKSGQLPELMKRIPESFGAYHEPFLGGGAMYFALSDAGKLSLALLSDINLELVNCWNWVKKDVGSLIRGLKIHEQFHNESYYYAIHARHNLRDSLFRACRFAYLNRACFNAMWRVNKKGEFNTAIGRPVEGRKIVFEPELQKASAALNRDDAIIKCGDFDGAAAISRGDFVYLNPPYHSAFSEYASKEFDAAAHKRLLDYCLWLDEIGAKFMMSNSDTPFVREIYRNFNIEIIEAKRGMSRSRELETIIKNY